MREAGMHDHSSVDRSKRAVNRGWSVRHARKRRRGRAAATIAILCLCAFGILFALRPASAAATTLLQQLFGSPSGAPDAVPEGFAPAPEPIVGVQSAEAGRQLEVPLVDFGSPERLSIRSWQGAKNRGDSFPVTLGGGSGSGAACFEAVNCSVFPLSGGAGDTFTVTVTGAGAYSLTAIVSEASGGELRDTKNGIAGKADQAPLSIVGWGGAQDYYDVFDIRVQGGTTGGEISFLADGCTISPETGAAGTTFTVTVTRVGSYELTAIMRGDRDYNDVHSAWHSGCSSKSNQSPVHIENWLSSACCNETFAVRIYGGSTREPLVIEPLGCEITALSSDEYEVRVTAVGPYAVTATRAGNYGYHEASASASGVAERAIAPPLSVSGWAEAKNCNDSFPVRVGGGFAGGTIRFAASGCTVAPASGTAETSFVVTVTSAGAYSLCAKMDATDSYEGLASRNYHGQAGKGVQAALRAESWNANAPAGGSFEFAVYGGSGTGALCVTTNDGCVARLKNGEAGVYLVTVHAKAGVDYSVSVSKAGDATYEDAAAQTFRGTTDRGIQTALCVSGWDENACAGDPFDIGISGGSGSGEVGFEADGCRVAAGQDGSYRVVVTALAGKPYSLCVKRAGDGNYASASTTLHGSVRPASALSAEQAAQAGASERVLVKPLSSVWIYAALLMMLGVALIALRRSRGTGRR